MVIAIDARALSWEGIGRYIRNMLKELCRQDDDLKYVALVKRGDLGLLKQVAEPAPAGKIRAEIVDGSYYSWREQTIFLRQAAKVKADLWHFAHFNVPVFFPKPYVVTIHDATRFFFPGQTRQYLLQQVAYEYVFKRAVERSRAVIAVSDATRQELAGLPLRLPASVRVIKEGVDEQFLKPVSQQNRQKVRLMLGTNAPYLLFVGVWMSHKNLVRLLEAFSIVQKERPELKLVITGRPKPGFRRLLSAAQAWGIKDSIILPGFVSSLLLPALYAEAECFVFPSLYEGFGLPVLEAAACGTPVVTSNATSLPEIMKEAAEYVNPEYVPGIARAVEGVLSDDERRAALSAAGKRRAEEFSWRWAAEEHAAVYREAI